MELPSTTTTIVASAVVVGVPSVVATLSAWRRGSVNDRTKEPTVDDVVWRPLSEFTWGLAAVVTSPVWIPLAVPYYFSRAMMRRKETKESKESKLQRECVADGEPKQ